MDSRIRTSKPLIKSQLAANAEADLWTQNNSIATMQDATGLSWAIQYLSSQPIHPDNPTQLIYRLGFSLKTECGAEDFLRHGVLAAKTDQRLLDLLGAQRIHLSLKPVYMEADTQDAVNKLLFARVRDYREQLGTQDLIPFKRKVICQWIDRSRQFTTP